MQQTGCIHLAGIGTGQQDHPQKALHPPSGQEEQHPRNAEHRVPQAVPEHGLLLPHPLHGTVHHALQIHQRHGRAQHPQIEPGLLAVVEQQGQRLAPHPEQRPRQRREAARQPEHPVQQAVQPGAFAPDVGLGDLRHQQHRKAPQQPEGKGEQRQGHSLQAAVLGHRGTAAPGIQQADRQAGGHQHVLRRVQGAGKAPPALHRPQDLPEPPGRVGRPSGLFCAERTHRLPTVKQQQDAGRHCFAHRRGGQHRRAAGGHVRRVPPFQRVPDDPDAHALLHQLAQHVGLHPPPGDKEPPQHSREGHPGHPESRHPQRARRPHISQPPPGSGPGQPVLRRHGRRAQQQPRARQTHQHPPRLCPAPGQLLRHQPGGRHRDPRRCQRDKERVDRQHQLVQPHPLAAQGVGQIDAQTHPGQPQQDIRPGQESGVFQVALPHRLPPSPAQAFGSVYAAFPGQYALL